MTPLRVLDLFSGIGGFSLGLERTGGFKTVAFCEIEPFPRRVLAKHWPEVPCYDDVRTLTADRLRADGIALDVICGGWPCQDLSYAGKGAGLAGERSGLWSQVRRLVGELRPCLVILENVSALLDRGLGDVLGDLASLGYDAEWHCIPAASVGLPHGRDRTWIVAYAQKIEGLYGLLQRGLRTQFDRVSDWKDWAAQQWPEAASRVRRIDDGLSSASQRIEALGNSVVPEIPELIGNAILASLAEQEAA